MQLLVIFEVALILFGPKWLPEPGKRIGERMGGRSPMKAPPADTPQKPSEETVLVRTDRDGWSR